MRLTLPIAPSQEGADKFAQPQHETGGHKGRKPIVIIQFFCTYDLSAKFHEQVLTEKNYCSYKQQPAALQQSRQCAAGCAENADIEQIPKLQEHKISKEKAFFVWRKWDSFWLKLPIGHIEKAMGT